MNKRIYFNAFLIILALLIFAGPAMAKVKNYRYTSSNFRFIGDVFYEKTIKFELHGGSAYFSIEGKGSASGSQYVTEVEYTSPALKVYEKITALSLQAYLTGTTALDAAEEEKMLVMSIIKLPLHDFELSTGVEMDQGETGFIKHDIISSRSPDGNYLQMNNHFGNTGGTTKRVLEIDGYLSEQMRVDGYAEVWDFTEMYDGKHKSGFWNMLP